MQRKVATFGHFPHWSPDGSKLLFQSQHFGIGSRIFVVDVRDGGKPREVLTSVTRNANILSATWHPDGRRISIWQWDLLASPIPVFWTGSIETSEVAVKTEISPEVLKLAEGEAGADEAEAHINQALQLSPRDMAAYAWFAEVGIAKNHLGECDQAVLWCRRAIEANRNYPEAYFHLASALARLGRFFDLA